jgi:adenylate kinase family enzyme
VVLGKTTLSNNLAEVLNLPVCHIDGIHHLENWEIRDKSERDKIILEKVKEEKWIIDGTYSSTLKIRLENSDLIIYLDYSSISQLKGVLGRYIKNHGKEKPEIPGCKERMTFKFFIWVLNWRKNKRNEIMKNLNLINRSKILIFKNRRKLNKWFYNEFNKKIKS